MLLGLIATYRMSDTVMGVMANVFYIDMGFAKSQIASVSKLFGLTIDPQRLSQIRNERRPGSKYADLANCRYEVSEAEAMMRRSGIRWLSSITKSIEEIATTILQEVRPERLAY